MSSDPEEPGPVELSGITLVCEFRHLSSWVTMNLSQTGAAPCWLPVLHWGEFSPLPGHWELGNLMSQHPGHQGISEKYLRISEKTLALLVGWGSMAASAIHVKGLMEVNRAFQSCKKLILEQQKYSVNIADGGRRDGKKICLKIYLTAILVTSLFYIGLLPTGTKLLAGGSQKFLLNVGQIRMKFTGYTDIAPPPRK